MDQEFCLEKICRHPSRDACRHPSRDACRITAVYERKATQNGHPCEHSEQ